MKFLRRLRSLFRKDKLDADMAEEMRLHVEFQTEVNLKAGMSSDEARYAALREFGNVASVQERSREQRAWRWFEETVRDVGYAVRQLVKAPGFSIVAILTLAIGIGATTSIFSVVNSVVLRPLNYPDPGQLVALQEWYKPQNRGYYVSPAALAQWEPRVTALSKLGAATSMTGNLTGAGEPLRIFTYQVTRDYLPTLQVQPMLGRGFQAEEYTEGKNRVMLLNHRTWITHFGGREDILGTTVNINEWPVTIIGVMPKDFQTDLGGPMAYVPFVASAEAREDFKSRILISVVGRLKSGVSLEHASREFNAIAADMERAHPQTHEQMGINVTPLLEAKVGKVRPLLWVLLGAVGCLLLIACVNVANLLLLRASARRREIALRASLGASRGRLIRQLLIESLCLAAIGGVLGTAFAYGSLQFLLSFAPLDLPRIDEVSVDGRALGFAFAATLLVGVGFGFVPAWQSTRGDLAGALKEGGHTSDGPPRQRLRGALVVAQVALALVLLIAAGLLARSFDRLKSKDLGYTPDVVYVSRIFLLWNKYTDNVQRLAFVDRVLEQYAGKPDLVASAFTTGFPHHQNPTMQIVVQGDEETDPKKMPWVNFTSITPHYFRVMSMPVLAGREFTAYDRADGARVAIVSRRFAEEFFPGANPLGKFISPPTTQRQWHEIVGVVPDIALQAPTQPGRPQVYLPFHQTPGMQFMSVVRTREGAANPVASVTASIHAVDPAMPVPAKLTCIAEYVANGIALQRFATFVFTCFSAVALGLAAMGLYGVMAYAVSQRTREIGIRMALGAQRGQVMRMILKAGGLLVSSGLVAGVMGAFAGANYLEALLYQTSPTDIPTYLKIGALLAAVALLACLVPAYRATKVNPMAALRAE